MGEMGKLEFGAGEGVGIPGVCAVGDRRGIYEV